MAARVLGHTLLWAGFLWAAYVSLNRLEIDDAKWSTIHWGLYALAMLVGCSGVVLLRIVSRHVDSDDTKTEAEYSVVQASLLKVLTEVDRLYADKNRHPSDVLLRIDNELAEPLSDFADARGSLIKRFGMETYAEVMTDFASAERYINRSWSAAADGYVDEVESSLGRARKYLENAQQTLLRQSSSSSTPAAHSG
ncbi:hypothetical protein [Novipirellula artificiosorum]|uniref:Uncharacterized protein n=1 Tax=Novipirellula artificiosorum TaxID=2528016 RepID=A0A5C6D7Z8_9BACT|nr:hypothetical protein [Novipirellula artificiosorum]TWU31019.1 hypothetical protein Poly41_64880 [Novipirellula artificiosorum]